MYWSKSFKMKRFGAPKVGSGVVGDPMHIVALDISASVCGDILQGHSLRVLLFIASHRGQCFPSNFLAYLLISVK